MKICEKCGFDYQMDYNLGTISCMCPYGIMKNKKRVKNE